MAAARSERAAGSKQRPPRSETMHAVSAEAAGMRRQPREPRPKSKKSIPPSTILPTSMETPISRAKHWLTQSVAIILPSKSASYLDCRRALLLLSTLSSQNACTGFPYYFLGVRKIKTACEYTGQVAASTYCSSARPYQRVGWSALPAND